METANTTTKMTKKECLDAIAKAFDETISPADGNDDAKVDLIDWKISKFCERLMELNMSLGQISYSSQWGKKKRLCRAKYRIYIRERDADGFIVDKNAATILYEEGESKTKVWLSDYDTFEVIRYLPCLK